MNDRNAVVVGRNCLPICGVFAPSGLPQCREPAIVWVQPCVHAVWPAVHPAHKVRRQEGPAAVSLLFPLNDCPGMLVLQHLNT